MKNQLCSSTWLLLTWLAVGHAFRLVGAPLFAAVLRVDEFGTAGDGKADDTAAVVAAVEALKAAGPGSRLEFGSGKTYRLGSLRAESIYQLDLRGLRDVTVDGGGAMLLVTPEQATLRVRGCEGVTVRNFVIEQEPLAFTQGIVTAVSPDQGWFEMQIMAGYPPLPTPEELARRGFTGWEWGGFIDPQLRRIRRGVRDHYRAERIEALEAGRARIHVQAVFAKDLAAIRPGDIFVQPLECNDRPRLQRLNESPFSYNISFENSGNCVLENVTLYSGRNSMAAYLGNNHGRITLRGFKIMVRPGTDRAISNWRDGIHCKDNRVGPLVEHCLFEGLLDDSINISQNTMMAERVISPDTYRLTKHPGGVPWTEDTTAVRVGDRLMVLYPTTGEYLGPFAVTRIDDADLQTVTLDAPLENVVPGRIVAGQDRRATHFYNLDQSNAGFVIRNNVFGPQRRHAILARAENGLIEHNLIVGTGGAAIELSNEFGAFYEGPIARGTVIRDNTIRDSYGTPIVVGSATGENRTRQARDIRVTDNLIEAAEGPAIRVTNARDVVVQNNRCVRPDGSELPDAVVKE